MNRRTALAGMTAALTTGAAAAAGQWKNEFAHQMVEDYKAHWRLHREYCLAFLEAMPDKHLDFKPTPGQMAFAEQFTHFCASNIWYFDRFERLTDHPRPKRPESHTRATTSAFVIASFDYVDEILDKLTEADMARRDLPMGSGPKHTAHDIFLRAMVHTAHHRGQVVCYLRLNGIEPPGWRFQGNGVG